MKKICVFTLMLFFTSIMFAQKGEKSIGLDLGYNTTTENTGIGLRFQYNLENRFRIAPSFNYFFENNDHSGLEANLDAHYLFPLTHGLVMYPVVGLNYSNIDWDGDEDGGFGINLGMGIQFPISKQISFGTEYKRAVLFDLSDMEIVTFNLAYKF